MIYIVRLLRGIHHAVLLFVMFGWLIPVAEVLFAHLIFIPLMVLQWWLNRGTCILTNLENKLLGTSRPPAEQDSQFIRSVISKVSDWRPSKREMTVIIYAAVSVSWTISACLYFR